MDIPFWSKFEPNTVITNHQSALQHPVCISKYLTVDIQKKAIMGPFKTPPFYSLHYSPMLTRPNAGSTNHRVNVDLSWPQGKSINDIVCTVCTALSPYHRNFIGTCHGLTLFCQPSMAECITGLDHCDNMAVVIQSRPAVCGILSWVAWQETYGMSQLPTILSSQLYISSVRKTFLQMCCRGGMGEEYQEKWLANCFDFHGVT